MNKFMIERLMKFSRDVAEAKRVSRFFSFVCPCGDGATAEKSPCGWVIHCDGRELEGLCGAHTANTHSTLEEAQAEWIKLGGKVYAQNDQVEARRS